MKFYFKAAIQNKETFFSSSLISKLKNLWETLKLPHFNLNTIMIDQFM